MSLGAPAFLHHGLTGPHCQLPRIAGTPQSGLRACGLCFLRPGAKDQGWHEVKISNPLSLGQSPSQLLSPRVKDASLPDDAYFLIYHYILLFYLINSEKFAGGPGFL